MFGLVFLFALLAIITVVTTVECVWWWMHHEGHVISLAVTFILSVFFLSFTVAIGQVIF